MYSQYLYSLYLQFGRYETDKALWDFFAHRYNQIDVLHQYQILSKLHQMRKKSGQSSSDFYSQMQFLWDKLSVLEPKWTSCEDATKISSYRDQQWLMMLLMALQDTFEPI